MGFTTLGRCSAKGLGFEPFVCMCFMQTKNVVVFVLVPSFLSPRGHPKLKPTSVVILLDGTTET